VSTAVVVGVASVLAFSELALGGGGGTRMVPGAPPIPTGSELVAVQQIALKAAADNGDAKPTTATLVPTTRGIAEEIDAGASVNSDQPVYFVVLHGHFTANGASIPEGASAPTGSVLTLTIDPNTNEITDLGIEDSTPDVGEIGVPVTLTLPSTAQ